MRKLAHTPSHLKTKTHKKHRTLVKIPAHFADKDHVKNRLISALLIGLLFTVFGQAEPGKTLYLSTLENDDSGAPLYWCKNGKCGEGHIKLSRATEVTVTGKEFSAQMSDPFDDSSISETFVSVRLKDNTEGYLPLYLLTEKKLDAFYSDEGDSRMPAAVSKNKKSNSLKAATLIYDLVGECPLKEPTVMPAKLPKENIFDTLVYNKLKKQKVPRLVNEQMRPMTTEDLINIDSLARTIYGEMGRCFRKGLQYPIAAALVAVNRRDNKARYKEWTLSRVKRKVASLPPLTKIVTTPEKFNVWKTSEGGKPNGPLHHSLCPARAVNKPFWKSKRASAAEVDIWKNAVRIATEAVMFPSRFKARSPAMRNINFYTSGMGQYQDYLQVFPFVNDRPLEHFECIEIWKEPGR